MSENKLSRALEEVWRFYEHDKQSLIEFFRSGYKHFGRKAKEKEADEMEKELNLKREAVQQIKSLLVPIPEDKLNELREKWTKVLLAIAQIINCEEILGQQAPRIVNDVLKEYEALKEGKEE